MSAPARTTDRRATTIAAIAAAVAGIAVWAATRLTWVSYVLDDGLTTSVDGTMDGAQWHAALAPLALVMIAGVAAMFAVRGWAVRVVGAVLVAVALAVAVPVIGGLTDDDRADRVHRILDKAGRVEISQVDVSVGPAVLALFGAVAACAAGIVLVLGRAGRAGLSGAYETPAARKDHAAEALGDDDGALDQRLMWDALDGGMDPTAEPGEDGAERRAPTDAVGLADGQDTGRTDVPGSADPAGGEPGHAG